MRQVHITQHAAEDLHAGKAYPFPYESCEEC